MSKQDVVIIGGGVGGLVTASVVAQMGMSVTLIEKSDKLGGDCLHYGCVPSKTFIHAAKVAQTMASADHCGLDAIRQEADLSKVNAYVKSVVDHIQVHDDPKRFESYGCRVLFGPATFVSKKAVECQGEIIEGHRIVIATGSSPNIPPIDGIDAVEYWTNETIFSKTTLPKSMIMLGAGVIGIELAQSLSRFGTKMTVVDMASRILPPIDEQAAKVVQYQLVQEGMEFVLSARTTKIEKVDERVRVVVEVDGKEQVLEADELFVATGRKPNVHGLELETAGVKYSNYGIAVNKKLRTSNRRILALGDVVECPYKFTHLAEHHAGVAIAQLVFHVPSKANLEVLPSAVFCDPEVAQVGKTQKELDDKGVTYETLKVEFSGNDRAIAQSQTQGFVKLFVRKNRIIGAVVVGPNASELISEIALAIKAKLKLGVISATIHAYPTLSQITMRTVNSKFAPKLYANSTKRLARILRTLLP